VIGGAVTASLSLYGVPVHPTDFAKAPMLGTGPESGRLPMSWQPPALAVTATSAMERSSRTARRWAIGHKQEQGDDL
jgi:hypothetical protein